MTANSNYKSPQAEQQAMAAYDAALARWPMPCTTRMVPTTVGDTFVISWGDEAAPPLVLLHGSASNSTSWGLDAAAYGKHFRVHAVDLPGETGRSTPARPPYGGPAYPDWLGCVFDALGIRSAAIVGLSLGGWAGMRFAAACPERVDRLALLAPGGLAPARKSFMLKAVLYSPFGKWGTNQLTRAVFSPDEPPPGAAEGFAFGLRNYNARRDSLVLLSDDELRRLTMPVLFVGGTRDALLDTGAGANRLRRLVPHAQLQVLPNAGHALIGMSSRTLEFLLE